MDELNNKPAERESTVFGIRFIRNWQSDPPSISSPRYLLTCLILALFCGLAAKASLGLAFINASATAVWPPTGIALFALLVFGSRVWPAIFVAAFVVALATAGTVATSLGIALGNTAEGLLGVFLIRKYAGGFGVLASARSATRFTVFAALLAPMLSATVGSIVYFPALLLPVLKNTDVWNRRKYLELCAFTLSLLLVSLVVFVNLLGPTTSHYQGAFFCIPFVLWAAFRFAESVAAISVVAMALIANWGTIHHAGPFSLGTANESLLMLQMFLGVMCILSAIVSSTVAERRRSTEASQKDHTLLRTAMDSTSDGILVVNSEGKVVSCNKQFQNLWRISDDLLGTGEKQALLRFVVGQLRYPDAFIQRIEELYRTEESTAGDIIEFKDGRVFERHLAPHRMEGRIVGRVWSFRDVTEASERWKSSSERLDLALRGGDLGIWDWNLSTGAAIYSDYWAEMLGYRPEEVEPHVDFFKRAIHPDDLPVVLDRLNGHLEGRTASYESEHRLRSKSGAWIWVMDRGRITEIDKAGSPVRVTGVISNIHERKRAELQAQENLKQFKYVLETTSDGYWNWNIQTGSAFYSPQWLRLLGYAEQDAPERMDFFIPSSTPMTCSA